MTKSERQFVKAVMLGLAPLIPGGSTVKGLADPLLDRLLKEDKEGSITQVIRDKGQDICRSFIAAEEAGVINPGSGYSAASDFTAIVGKANITPQLLIELQLDEVKLAAHLKDAGKEELKEASQGRRGVVLNGIDALSKAVIEMSPDSPGVRLEFMRSVLRGSN